MLFQSVIKKNQGRLFLETYDCRKELFWHAYDAAKASEGVFWKLMAVLIGGMPLCNLVRYHSGTDSDLNIRTEMGEKNIRQSRKAFPKSKRKSCV